MHASERVTPLRSLIGTELRERDWLTPDRFLSRARFRRYTLTCGGTGWSAHAPGIKSLPVASWL